MRIIFIKCLAPGSVIFCTTFSTLFPFSVENVNIFERLVEIICTKALKI